MSTGQSAPTPDFSADVGQRIAPGPTTAHQPRYRHDLVSELNHHCVRSIRLRPFGGEPLKGYILSMRRTLATGSLWV